MVKFKASSILGSSASAVILLSTLISLPSYARIPSSDFREMPHEEQDPALHGVCEEEVLSRPPGSDTTLEGLTRMREQRYIPETGLIEVRHNRVLSEFGLEPGTLPPYSPQVAEAMAEELTVSRIDAVGVRVNPNIAAEYERYFQAQCNPAFTDFTRINEELCNSRSFSNDVGGLNRRHCVINALRNGYAQRTNQLDLAVPYPNSNPPTPPAVQPPSPPIQPTQPTPPPSPSDSGTGVPPTTSATIPPAPPAPAQPGSAGSPAAAPATGSTSPARNSSQIPCVARRGIVCLMDLGTTILTGDNADLGVGSSARFAIIAGRRVQLTAAGTITLPVVSGGSRVSAESNLQIPVYTYRDPRDGTLKLYANSNISGFSDLFRNDGRNVQGQIRFDAGLGAQFGFHPGRGPIQLVLQADGGLVAIHQTAANRDSRGGVGFGVTARAEVRIPIRPGIVFTGRATASIALPFTGTGDASPGLTQAQIQALLQFPLDRRNGENRSPSSPTVQSSQRYVYVGPDVQVYNANSPGAVPWQASIVGGIAAE